MWQSTRHRDILSARRRMTPLGTQDMDKFITITIEQHDAIEILSLNRPDALNAVTPTMADELIAYFSGLHDRLSTRIVILRGNGRAFCAGAELGSDAFAAPGEGRPQRQLDMQQRYSRIIRLMRSCPQPIVALIHGAACGAGFSLLLASDVRFATPAARMNAAYIRVGVGGSEPPRRVLLGMGCEAGRGLRRGLLPAGRERPHLRRRETVRRRSHEHRADRPQGDCDRDRQPARLGAGRLAGELVPGG